MPTSIDVVNIGLVALGERPLASFDGQTVPQLVAAAVFRQVLREALVLFPWAAAAARASLVEISPAPSWGWRTAWQLPSDFLSMRAVLGLTRADWAVAGSTLLVEDDGPIDIAYTRDVSINVLTGRPLGDGDDLPIDALLARVIGLRFGLQVAESITGTINRSQMLQQEYVQAFSEARAADSRQRPFLART